MAEIKTINAFDNVQNKRDGVIAGSEKLSAFDFFHVMRYYFNRYMRRL